MRETPPRETTVCQGCGDGRGIVSRRGHELPCTVCAPDRTTERDPLADRADIGAGYWQARRALAATFPIHPKLWEYPLTELREALSACADAFAAYVLLHQSDVPSACVRAEHADMLLQHALDQQLPIALRVEILRHLAALPTPLPRDPHA